MTTPTKRPRPRTNHGGGWNPKGEMHPAAVLTEANVLDIRRQLLAGVSRAALAHAYGVTASNIRAIAERRSWAHVLPPHG